MLCCVDVTLHMENSPIDSLMFTTFSLILKDLNILKLLKFMRIFFSCFDKVA